MAAGRAVNTESHGLPGGRRPAHRPRLRQGEPGHARDHGARRLLHRRRGRPADAGAQGQPRGRRTWPSCIAGQHPHPIKYDNVPSVTYCHPEVASIGLTEDQAKEQKLDYQVGRFPFSANGRARSTERDRGLRQDHPGQEVRRDPRGAHRGQPRLGDDPRAGGGAGERVHGRGSRSRHPRPPDPLGGDRRGGARLDGASHPHLTVDPIRLAALAMGSAVAFGLASVSATVLGVDLLRSARPRRRPELGGARSTSCSAARWPASLLRRRRRLAAALARSCPPTGAAGSRW